MHPVSQCYEYNAFGEPASCARCSKSVRQVYGWLVHVKFVPLQAIIGSREREANPSSIIHPDDSTQRREQPNCPIQWSLTELLNRARSFHKYYQWLSSTNPVAFLIWLQFTIWPLKTKGSSKPRLKMQCYTYWKIRIKKLGWKTDWLYWTLKI